ncbi:DOMON domain-containing protein FRRS1L isoform X1 [Mustela putorius furo]|uniref:DOMON domain-containing protein FRRS1L isoform X1 n=1 Tax=Mustela putorius furo TaxID=9669 RepID=A0A8U0SAJ2_MUSPF|nr:DOMON domain-containing protein FRRS1L isoform X1 [Mustela putorius furo]
MRRARRAAAGTGGCAAARAAGGGGRVLTAAVAVAAQCSSGARGAPATAPNGLAAGSVRSDGTTAPAAPGGLGAAALAAAGGAHHLRRQPRRRRRGPRGPGTPGPRAGGHGRRRVGAAPRLLLWHLRRGVLRPALPVRGGYGKPGCNAETCDYFLSYRMIGADVEFELSADTDGWVAVGFSSDKKMGGDDVMACVHDDNGRVRIQHFYNVGQWAKEIQRNPARDEEGVFENNRVTCRFKRPVNVPRDETIVDLHLSWYYLFAWGPAIQGSITRHDIDSPPTSERVVSIYKYEDIFMPSAAYQTFSSPFCLLLIVALTFYLLMGTP